jgi:hypothetical protein
MVRYTYYYKDKLELAVAAEMPELLMRNISASSFNVYAQYQRIPDFVMHIKYQRKFGHVQAGALLSIMNYGDSTQTKKSVFESGFGVSLSGTFNLWKNATLYYQFDGGKGIGSYVQDLSVMNCDLLPTFFGSKKMTTVWMYGGYVAFQQYWNNKIHSNLIYGRTRLQTPVGGKDFFTQYLPWYYKYGQYFAINTLWNFFDYATVGIEYLWGERVNLNGIKGLANRVNLLLQYDF